MACFGVPAATLRVVATRMREEGWLESRREGRETVYALTDAAWELLDRGRDRIFRRARDPWDGQWSMVVYSVPETERAPREQLRKNVAWFGYGPLSSAVWLSPHDRTDVVLTAFADHPAVQLHNSRSRSAGAGAEPDRDIATRAWSLNTWIRTTWLLETYRPRLAGYRDGALSTQEALVERMRLIHDYRLSPFRDPDLPPQLLPAGWRGRRAREVFLRAGA
jgi:phenylacetic acid degradation operon negative regulatory protein